MTVQELQNYYNGGFRRDAETFFTVLNGRITGWDISVFDSWDRFKTEMFSVCATLKVLEQKSIFEGKQKDFLELGIDDEFVFPRAMLQMDSSAIMQSMGLDCIYTLSDYAVVVCEFIKTEVVLFCRNIDHFVFDCENYINMELWNIACRYETRNEIPNFKNLMFGSNSFVDSNYIYNRFEKYFFKEFRRDVRNNIEFENDIWIKDPDSASKCGVGHNYDGLIRALRLDNNPMQCLFFSGSLLYQLFVGFSLWDHHDLDNELKPCFYDNKEWFEVGGTLWKHISWMKDHHQLIDVLKCFGIMPSKYEKDLFIDAWEWMFDKIDGNLLDELDCAYEMLMTRKEGRNIDIRRYDYRAFSSMGDEIMNDLYIEQIDKIYNILKKDVRGLLHQLISELRGKVVAKDRDELEKLVNEAIAKNGCECDLNFIDVSQIKDMRALFQGSDFVGNISEWNVSNVTDMRYMFAGSKFNGDISHWNVSKVKCMDSMFAYSEFDGDISHWDVSRVNNMRYMFAGSKFNGDISRWNVSNVTNMSSMFDSINYESVVGPFADYSEIHSSMFNGDISHWNVSKVTDMQYMFAGSAFNGDINSWNVSEHVNVTDIFEDCPLKENPPKWYKELFN